jgi:hypothetical protein
LVALAESQVFNKAGLTGLQAAEQAPLYEALNYLDYLKARERAEAEVNE